ncbi:MAG: type II toxin-antitoxin system VapC family toxin [Candidatus Methylacidiphilaceae bacterium]
MVRSYIDSNVWITAVQCEPEAARRAFVVLDDPQREILFSDLVRLETLPKPRFHCRQREVEALEALFEAAGKLPLEDPAIFQLAVDTAARHDLQPMDALHVAISQHFGIDEFVTFEKPTKPIFRVAGIKVLSLHLEKGAGA